MPKVDFREEVANVALAELAEKLQRRLPKFNQFSQTPIRR
jgi:hypothetical protein